MANLEQADVRDRTPTDETDSTADPLGASRTGRNQNAQTQISPELLAEINRRVHTRGGGRPNVNGNVRFTCPHCQRRDKTCSWNADKLRYICHGCGSRGGYLKLADALGIPRPTRRRERTDRYTDQLNGYRQLAVDGIDWIVLVTRYGSGSRRPQDIARSAASVARTYLALVNAAIWQDTLTPDEGVSVRDLAEAAGTSTTTIGKALVILRRAGFVRLVTPWHRRTIAAKQRRSHQYALLPPPTLFCRDTTKTVLPEGKQDPAYATVLVVSHAPGFRYGAISQAGRALLWQLVTAGPATAADLAIRIRTSRRTINRQLGKLIAVGLVHRIGTTVALVDGIDVGSILRDHPDFERQRQALARQRQRHAHERHSYDLNRVLEGNGKWAARVRLADGTVCDTGTGEVIESTPPTPDLARQDAPQSTITDRDGSDIAPTYGTPCPDRDPEEAAILARGMATLMRHREREGIATTTMPRLHA